MDNQQIKKISTGKKMLVNWMAEKNTRDYAGTVNSRMDAAIPVLSAACGIVKDLLILRGTTD